MTRPEPSSDLAADDTRTTGTDAAGPASATATTAGEAESRPDGQQPDTGPETDPQGQSAIDTDDAEPPESRDEEPPQRPITSAARRTGKVRKARLRLLRVEPWSVMKSAFVLSIAIGITFVVAAATLWSIIDAAGVFEVVGGLVTDLTESETATGVEVTDYVGFSRVVGLATVIAVVDVVLLTALATLFAFLYNLSAALLGGLEITLAEDD